MSINVLLKKQVGSGESFSFPMEMKLDENVAKKAKILPALRRIAKKLVSQGQAKNGEEIIGIEFIEIGFSYKFQMPKK